MKRKTKTLALAVALAAAMSSCQEHEPFREFTDLSLTVGSILCADGSTVPASAYSPEMNGVGVIVRTGTAEDGFRFIAMAKEDIGQYPYVAGENTDLYVDSGADSELLVYDGKENTAAMIARTTYKETTREVTDEDGNKHKETTVESLYFPAAMACVSYMTGELPGWHLPSCGEWIAASLRAETLRRSMEKIGGRWIETDQWYMSSSQDGSSKDTMNYYNMMVSPSGTVRSSLKTLTGNVRPFITIR